MIIGTAVRTIRISIGAPTRVKSTKRYLPGAITRVAGAPNRSSRSRSRPPVTRQMRARVAASTPSPVVPPIRIVISSWYLTASCGSTPDRICPVIMPHGETTPVAANELMIGVNPLRTARWRTSETADHLLCPSSNRAAMTTRSRCSAVIYSLSKSRLVPRAFRRQLS